MRFMGTFLLMDDSLSSIGRNTMMQLSSPADPMTIQNLPFDAEGNVIPARAVPKGAGFGVANVYQSPRAIQIQVRVSF
jgi:hypothetical protein